MIDKFLDSLKDIYSDKSTQVIQGLKMIQPTSFRVNLTKVAEKGLSDKQILEGLTSQGYKIQKGPLVNSYYFSHEPEKTYISDTPEFKEGLIYVQELSSMVPPILLDPQPGEKILDMSAAPGSKTTQLADLAKNKAEILAIEKHPIRIKTLEHNVALQRSQSVEVLLGNGIKFDRRHPQFTEYFDKVLVDAPCSSEGQINLNNPKSYKYWNIHKRKDMSKIQKGLLMSGYRMLRPGGVLVYSTCTFGVEENELVLQWFLEKVGADVDVIKIDLGLANVLQGRTTWQGAKLDKNIAKAVRIMPNRQFTGFFVARITKHPL